MKQLTRAIFGLGLACLVLGDNATASEEDIAGWRSVAVVAQCREPVGEVRVTAEIQGAGFDVTLKTLKITSGGRKLTVPKQAIATIMNPMLDTLRVSCEPGHDGRPWLYVSFGLAMPKPGTPKWDYPRIYLAFQEGKFVKRFSTVRAKDGGRVFGDEWKPSHLHDMSPPPLAENPPSGPPPYSSDVTGILRKNLAKGTPEQKERALEMIDALGAVRLLPDVMKAIEDTTSLPQDDDTGWVFVGHKAATVMWKIAQTLDGVDLKARGYHAYSFWDDLEDGGKLKAAGRLAEVRRNWEEWWRDRSKSK